SHASRASTQPPRRAAADAPVARRGGAKGEKDKGISQILQGRPPAPAEAPRGFGLLLAGFSGRGAPAGRKVQVSCQRRSPRQRIAQVTCRLTVTRCSPGAIPGTGALASAASMARARATG